jgi:hypothetical protein
MPSLRVEIVRFVDEYQPGVVACEFTDATGNRHTIVDKVPMFSSEQLWSDSKYPTTGDVRCTILSSWHNSTGQNLSQITIDKPDGLEASNGLSEFVVLASQILNDQETPNSEP